MRQGRGDVGIESKRIIKLADAAKLTDTSDYMLRSRLRAKKIEEEAKSKAITIITNAEQQAKDILKTAKNEADQFTEITKRKISNEANAAAANRLVKIFNCVQEELDDIDSQIIVLVKEILEKVIGSFDDVTKFEKIVSQVVSEFQDTLCLTLAVNPSQVSSARRAIERINSENTGRQSVVNNVIADVNIKNEDCFLITNKGMLNISVETQISKIIECLYQALHSGAE